ncbi:MAG: hypothetical protein Kow0059_20710 [Candidatus Sumerlaeia bacterium]
MSVERMITRICAAAALALIAAGPARADKLDDLGLTRDGRPRPDALAIQVIPPDAALLHLPGPEGLTIVERRGLKLDAGAPPARQAAVLIEALLAGPTAEERAAGLRAVFPAGARLAGVEIGPLGVADVRIELPAEFLNDQARLRAGFDTMSAAVLKTLQNLPLAGARIVARPIEDAGAEFRPLDRFFTWPDPPRPAPAPDTARPSAPAPQAPAPGTGLQNYVPSPGSARPVGSLTGKAVYLNPGHGWVWRPVSQTWGVQRGFVYNNIEDFSNPDWIQSYLIAYCYNAGADVFTVREADPNTNMVIVDNDDGNDGTKGYFEQGTGWFNSSLAGFANGHAPYSSGQDPFSFGTNRLNTCVTGAPTASATWIPQIPAAGWYNVYVSHAAYTNRSPQAHYRIHHAGGTTDFYLDQRMRRFTWIPIGRYYFEAGVNPDTAKVVLFNDSSSTSHYISADAVRFGGGMGLIYRETGGVGSVSGKPRYEEDGRYQAQFNGAPTSVYDASSTPETDNQADEADGWLARPRLGRWWKQEAEAYGAPAQDSVFISSHTNAGGGSGLGTFVYTGQEGTWHDRFRDAVHDEVLNDLHNGYSTTFNNHGTGKKYGTYSENNPSNVSNLMPIFLGEWLFHDSAADMTLYHDPKFRMMMARAIYQGIVKFWAAENGSPATLLPEPPRQFRVEVTGPDQVRLRWQAPETDTQGIRGDPATGYKYYISTHGRAFPPGVDVPGGAVTEYTVTGLTPGQTYYFYLTATNAGGESLPTEVLAARPSAGTGDFKLLIVSGFDKLDVSTRLQTPWSGDVLYRQIIPLMNSHDYIVEHARAIAAWGQPVTFDSCEDEVIEAGGLTLDAYDAVIWIAGIQSEVSTTDPTDDVSVSPNQQTALTDYINGGGKLFLSGAEVAWDLDRAGSTTWVDTTLKANYVNDDAGVYSAWGATGSIFEGLGPIAFDDGTGSTYHVRWPDTLAPTGGSIAAMNYSTTAAGAASPGGRGAEVNLAATVLIDGFETIGGWKDPNYSGQTNADAASTFDIAASPVHGGSGSGDLYYVWGTGSFIREFNSSLPELPAASVLSVWIYGDNSGHQVRLCVRDSDNDLFVSDWLTINFSTWTQIQWDLTAGPTTLWVLGTGGNGTLDGPNVRLDSIHVQKVTATASGHLYFDDAEYTTAGPPPVGDAAAVQWAAGDESGGKVVFMGFPFETIMDAAQRNDVMARVLNWFSEAGSAVTGWALHE